jgi:glycosyltransferase involved in cell wall biosynthesis
VRVGLVIYGSLETLSGGYLYDRKLVETLRLSGDKVEIVSFPWRSYPAHVGQNFAVTLRRQLADLQVDILLQDELNHPSLFLLNGWLRKQVKYPILSIVHHLRVSEGDSLLYRGLYRWIESAYLRTVDGFVFNSHTTRLAVERCCGCAQDGLVATPGGDPIRTISRNIAHSQDNEILQLLFVGNVIPRKNLHTLIAALAKLSRKDWRLNVIGRTDIDSGYTRRIIQLIKKNRLSDRINLMGWLQSRDLDVQWSTSHVLVVPSLYEGFGIVYLEAMGNGVVPVGGTEGGAGEIIQHGVNGFLVDPDNVDNLKNLLEELLTDRDHLNELSLAARKRYQSMPTWQESMLNIRKYLLDWVS